MTNKLPPLHYLNQCFIYDENGPSGLRWSNRPSEHFKTSRGYKIFTSRCLQQNCGYIADNGSKKYWIVKVDQVKYYCHRIIYFLNTGIDPQNDEIDHKDLNGLNNKTDNLRLATRQENACNRGSNANSTSKYKGVCFEKRTQKWYAQITFLGKNFYLGRHDTAELARDAYNNAVKDKHQEFYRLSK
jgi:hypothetical protein